jgi:hypothetical protein
VQAARSVALAAKQKGMGALDKGLSQRLEILRMAYALMVLCRQNDPDVHIIAKVC